MPKHYLITLLLSVSKVLKVYICSLVLLSRVVLLVEDCMNTYCKLKNKLRSTGAVIPTVCG